MERLTTRLDNGGYSAEGRSAAESLAALGRYEDLHESLYAERELVQLNLDELKKAGRARSATYATLMGSRYMLDDMIKRVGEPSNEIAARLISLKKMIAPEDDGIHDVEE